MSYAQAMNSLAAAFRRSPPGARPRAGKVAGLTVRWRIVPLVFGIIALPALCAAQVHPEILIGCDGESNLVGRFNESRPYLLPASRFPGIEGYADGMPGFASLAEARPIEHFFPPDAQSKLVFVLVGADHGVAVWNDHGTGLMRAGETFLGS
jgi:hypothetical protein